MKPVAQALDTLSVPYAVVGAVAGLTHGYSRFTMDIDTVAFLTQEAVAEFVQFLATAYYVDEPMIRDAIRRNGSFNLLHHETGLKIDFFIPPARDWHLQVALRREPEAMDNDPPAFFVQSAEDLVLSKLRWFVMTGCTSDRQWNDVLGVLKMQQFSLDFDYLEKWAAHLNVSDLLKKALDESGITESTEETESNGDSD